MSIKKIEIPYHTGTLPLHVHENNLKAVITPLDPVDSGKSGEELVLEALANPIGTPRLRDMAADKKKILVITSDHTRAMPSKVTLPILLREIRAGAPEAEVAIIISTGLHRATTKEEQYAMFGAEIVDNETIHVHDCTKDEDMREVCTLPSSAKFIVNRLAVECDLLVSEGFIEPHFFAGFSGGRKSVLPGIASFKTVNTNHSYKALAGPYSVAGVLEKNPVHIDAVAAARAVNLAFILNVAMDSKRKIIAAFAGDMEAAHLKGCEFVSSFSKRPAVEGDIVVTSNGGYPLDQNLYQAPKATSTAALCAGEDGVIIMLSGCRDGFGGDFFQDLILSGTVEEIDQKLSQIPPEETIQEQWSAQIFSKVMKKHPVIFVTDGIDPELIKKANFLYAKTPDEALEIAYSIKGRDAQVVVIPDGVAAMIAKP